MSTFKLENFDVLHRPENVSFLFYHDKERDVVMTIAHMYRDKKEVMEKGWEKKPTPVRFKNFLMKYAKFLVETGQDTSDYEGYDYNRVYEPFKEKFLGRPLSYWLEPTEIVE